MNDANKTKEQLIKEINTLREQLQQHQNRIVQAGEMLIKSEAYSKRMDSVETLARGIAHNFNNIFCGILGYISLIKSKMGAGNEYENICKIEFLAQRASILIKKLLDFVQGKKYLAKPIHCTHIINSNQTILQKSLNQNITMEINCQCEGDQIMGDEELIQQAILNLCLNAQDAMPSGGKLQMIAKTEVLNTSHAINGAKIPPGRYFLLQVLDTGKGMSQQTLDHIFDPFFTTKEVGEGSGLGLAIVYGIMKSHKGFIDVQSRPETGTTCTLYFPVVKDRLKRKEKKND